MPSIRKILKENINGSKNTRMDILYAGVHGNWRPDELAHISRYDKIVSLMMAEAKEKKRPISLLEVGCGQIWTLRMLECAHVITKKEVVSKYYGYDIDPDILRELKYWPNSEGDLKESTWIKKYNADVVIQDLTVNPLFENVKDEEIDFFYTTEVIEHMKPECVEPWLKEANRALKIGGLVYISTPNHEGSRDKLPKDHVYEWGFKELKTLLEKYFRLEYVVGNFIQMNNFKKAQANHGFWSAEQLELLTNRYGEHWLRVILATPYPQHSNNCSFIMRKAF